MEVSHPLEMQVVSNQLIYLKYLHVYQLSISSW